MTMHVSLTPHLETYIQGRVQSGDFATASEFVREAVREKRDRDFREEELRALILEGINSGPGVPHDEVFADLRLRLKEKYSDEAEKA
jgi:antitoxin ParD1/3/4